MALTKAQRAALRENAVRHRWHRWLLELPLLGRHLRTLESARFASTLAMLAGIALPAAIMHAVDPARYLDFGAHVLSGGAVLGAFFIATAYWDWELDNRTLTRSSLALWASGLLKTRFWI